MCKVNVFSEICKYSVQTSASNQIICIAKAKSKELVTKYLKLL